MRKSNLPVIPEQGTESWMRRYCRELHSLYLALRDSRTPWYAKAIACCVLAYALSPIDLIPDPIPVLGQLDDLLLVPLGLAVVWRLIPADVLTDCRKKAKDHAAFTIRGRWLAALGVIVVWAAALVWLGIFLYRLVPPWFSGHGGAAPL